MIIVTDIDTTLFEWIPFLANKLKRNDGKNNEGEL